MNENYDAIYDALETVLAMDYNVKFTTAHRRNEELVWRDLTIEDPDEVITKVCQNLDMEEPEDEFSREDTIVDAVVAISQANDKEDSGT